ncbi:Fic family protein [Halomicrococcus sp. NG-SE-24]|uniref:Fic family protein n=1 Tax=Halomicrococcus sp. NG-SE-24 TaxID=3436928 RepID=UPI003D995022
MSTEGLPESAPGEYVSYGRNSYYKPDPLPPSQELDMSSAFYELLSDATFWLGKLSGFSTIGDFPPVLYTSLLRKEAMESAEIEGADVDFNTVFSAETQPYSETENASTQLQSSQSNGTTNAQEVLNYETALENGIKTLDEGGEITIDMLHSLHETLLTGLPESRSETETIGEFKQTPNVVGSFFPPPPEKTEGMMEALLTYIRTGGSYHPLVDIALVHYQFETIHPYGDGNGRVGRLLVVLQLYDAGYLEHPSLYLSEYFNRNKQTYVDRMEAVRETGAWEDWLTFFITGVKNQARESVDRFIALRNLQQQYEEEYGETSYAYARLARNLFETPYFTAPEAAKMLDVERSTAYRAIERLQEDGRLEEVTGKKRYKEFRATEIFDILEQPPQTY